MKTLIVYELVPEETKFFVVDGDRSDLNGHFVNTVNWESTIPPDLHDQLSEPEQHFGAPVKMPLTWPWKDGLVVVHCGFLL